MAAETAVIGDCYSTAVAVVDWIVNCHTALPPRKNELLESWKSLFQRAKDAGGGAETDAIICEGLLSYLPDICVVFEKASRDNRLPVSESSFASFVQIKAEAEEALLFMVLLAQSLVRQGLKPAGFELAVVTRIVEQETTEASFRSVILRVLMRAFNLLAASPVRFSVLERLVTFAVAVNMPEAVHGYCGRMLQWLADAERPQRLAICRQLLKVLDSKADSEAERFALLKTMVADLDASGEADKALCAEFAVLALRLPRVVLFDAIVASRCVQQLQRDAKHRSLWPLLQTFHEGSIQSFEQLPAEVFEQWDLDKQQLRRKLAMVVVCSMAAHGQRNLAMADIAATLGVSSKEAEEVAADAVSNGLIAGHVNQLADSLVVASGLQRSFTKAHWEQLAKRVDCLTATVNEVLNTLLIEPIV